MDHLRISALNPRQCSLAKQSSLKSYKAMPKQAKAKRDCYTMGPGATLIYDNKLDNSFGYVLI